jgi:hypothetical protein
MGGSFTANVSEAVKNAFGVSSREITIPLSHGEVVASPSLPQEADVFQKCETDDDRDGGEGPVFIAEVAWMGSAKSAADEWIELANPGAIAVDVSGWQLYDQGEKLSLTLPPGTSVPRKGQLLLVREGATVDAQGAATVPFRGAVNNSRETLTLFDRSCAVVDAVEANPSWPAGDHATKRTMERDLSTRAWHDSALPGGTPGLPNSHMSAVSGTPSAVALDVPAAVLKPTTVTQSAPNTVADPSTQEAPPLPPPAVAWCSQDTLPSPTGAVLLHEVAWAGTGSGKTTDEWIELWNPSGAPVPLAGWQLLSRSRALALSFSSSSILEPYGYFLIERKEDAVPWIHSDALFSGVLKNNDESLRLFDRDCRLVDEVLAGTAWPAGTAAPDYRTAERSRDRSWHTFNWSAINGIYGTPRMVNSEPAPPPSLPTEGGSGIGTSSDAPSPTSVNARVLISEVMAGSEGNASDEFVELYNPGDTPTNLTGWCVKKQTSTGSESTLVTTSRLEGISIAPRRYLLLANDGGYRGASTPDVRWPSSYTLAYASNAVLLYRECADKEDEAAWTEIPMGQSLVRDGWDATTFHAESVPTPRNAQGE